MDVDQERLREVCERYGVASSEVFGSVARSEERQDSDVDLLYVLKPNARLGSRPFDLEDELAALFGRPVDLIARKAINKYIREQVLAEARRCELQLLLRGMSDAAVAIRRLGR